MTRTRTRIDFEKFINESSIEDLMNAGFRDWEINKDLTLLLIPKEMYDDSPENFELITINNEIRKFKRGVTNGDHRGGMLAFGIDKRRIIRDDKIKEILN